MLLTSIAGVWFLLATVVGLALLRASKRQPALSEVCLAASQDSQFESEARYSDNGRSKGRAKRASAWETGALGAHGAAHA